MGPFATVALAKTSSSIFTRFAHDLPHDRLKTDATNTTMHVVCEVGGHRKSRELLFLRFLLRKRYDCGFKAHVTGIKLNEASVDHLSIIQEAC